MIVHDLRQHLADLSKLVDSAGGKAAAKDLASAADALAPFGAQSIAEFGRFLGMAHEYHTTGKLTAPAKPARASRAKAKADPAEVATTIRGLYDRSGDLSLAMEQIDAELAPLAGLTKPGLLVVAERMELAGMKAKKVNEIRAAIRQKILDRRSSAQREQMTAQPYS
jgi:hypothetical protein